MSTLSNQMKRMKKLLTVVFVSGALALANINVQADECPTNLGQLTSQSIAAGFDQGAHASSFAGEPRVGLANIVERGNLAATVQLLVILMGVCSS